MRQGPTYNQWSCDDSGNLIAIPIELWEEFIKFRFVEWIDNCDGTYTLRPHDD